MISYGNMKHSGNIENAFKEESEKKSNITKVATEEQVLEELLGSKSSRTSEKADSKSKLALDAWKTRFFSLVHDLKRTLFKKRNMITSSSWLLNELENRSGVRLLKKQPKKSKKDISDDDSIDLESLDPSTDPSTIRCNFSRVQVYLQRLFRQLSEHINIIEKLLIPLNASIETDLTHPQNKNPLYRALFTMTSSEREILLQYCNNQIESCKQEYDKLDSKEAITKPKEKKSKSPAPSLPNALQPSALPISQIIFMNDAFKSNPSTSEQDIMIMKSGSQRLDGQLEEVSHGVTHLKVIAKDIEQEVVQQNQDIPDISTRVDQVDIELQAADSKVRKALSKVSCNNSGNKIIFLIARKKQMALVFYIMCGTMC